MFTSILWVFRQHLFCYQQHELCGFYCNIFLSFVVFCAQVCIIVDGNAMPWMRVGGIIQMLLYG